MIEGMTMVQKVRDPAVAWGKEGKKGRGKRERKARERRKA